MREGINYNLTLETLPSAYGCHLPIESEEVSDGAKHRFHEVKVLNEGR